MSTRIWQTGKFGAWTDAAYWGGTVPGAGDTAILAVGQATLATGSVLDGFTLVFGGADAVLTGTDIGFGAGLLIQETSRGALAMTGTTTQAGTIEVAGTLQLSQAADGSGNASLTNTGLISIGSGGVIDMLSGALTNNGSIAVDAGTLALYGNLDGSGTISLSAGGKVDVQGSLGGAAFAFLDAHGTLALSASSGGTASLSGFQIGDLIDIGQDIGSLQISGNVLTLGSLQFHLTGPAYVASDFSLSSDGQSGTDLSVIATPAAAPADLNGDGTSDILLQSTDGTLAAWLMNGPTVTGGGVVADPGTFWHLDTTGDFSGSGTADLLLQGNDGSVAVWMMNGTTIAAGAVVANPGTAWHVEGTGDFSGSGTADILLQGDDGTVAMWMMNGDTLAGAAIVADPGPSWHVVGTGDFNGTGTTDILLQAADGSVAIWDMNGSTITGSSIVAQPGPTWQVVATGDFNDDGKTDIVEPGRHGGHLADEWRHDHLRRNRGRSRLGLACRGGRRLCRRGRCRHPAAGQCRRRGDLADERHHAGQCGIDRQRAGELADHWPGHDEFH